jgi:hypothetical protein
LKDIASHSSKATRDESIKKWNREECTVDDGPTNAFGKIKFHGYDYAVAKYIRASYRTEIDTIVKYFFQKWKLKEPKLLISVTGGAKVSLNYRLRESFCKSLAKVASTTSNISNF